MKNKQTLFKNLACVSFCLFTFFMASIFVSETYYNRIINEQIQDLSLLKSSHFQEWGSMQAPSSVIHKFVPYVYGDNDEATLFNESLKYQYTFEYKDYSFTQGNTGNIRYLNSWKKQLISNIQNNEQKIKVFNVDAESVYNYDYYAPKVRQFTLTYNLIYDSLVNEFLPLFYATYMSEYLFSNQSMVYTRVLKPLGLSQKDASVIYNDKIYGMSTPQQMTQWIKLSQSIQDQSFYSFSFYQGLINDLKLTKEQIMYLSGPRSTLSAMLISIKSILKYKLNKLDDDRCADDLCTDQQLIAAQLGVGFLTKQTIFTSTQIGKYINQLNTTLLNSIEYKAFCESRPQLEQCSGDDNTAAITFFIKNPFAEFAEVQFLLNNLNNPQTLQALYDLPPGEGQSIIEYIKFLYTNTFNLPKNSLTLNKQLNEKDINEEAFKRSFTNYNHLEQILESAQQILFVELHTRAFFNKFITQDKNKCEDYYTGDFQKYKGDCAKLALNTIQGVRVYVKTYLGKDTDQFMNLTSITTKQEVYNFFHSIDKSLLAKQLTQLSSDMSAQYKCQSKTYCSSTELFFIQWKSGQVLSNLPQVYFKGQQKVSINKWDFQNRLNSIEPQLYKYVNVSQELDPKQILNSDSTGIYSMFNLMKVYNDKQGSLFDGLKNADLLVYIQSLVMNIEFQGMHLDLTISEFLNSHQSPIIEKKRAIDPHLGGAPWLSPSVSVLKLSNQPQKFNYINSGIYDQQKLRSISQIEDNVYSSSTYQVYKSDQDDVSVTYTSENKVGGTNLFGFQTKIQQNENIKGYFDMIYQAKTLPYKQSIEWKNSNGKTINAYKFQIEDNQKFSVNVEELSNRTVELSKDTYFIVEPNTGITLEYYIKYTVLSKPFYTEYAKNSQTKGYPLYQGQITFVNENTSKIVGISDDQWELKILFLSGIVLSSLSFVSFIVMLILYRKTRRGNKYGEQNKSLMSSQTGSLAQ